MRIMTWPWQDRSGNFAPLKALVLVLLCYPALRLAWLAGIHDLGPRPWNAAVHFTGNWGTWLLMASLVVTPLRQVLRWGKLIPTRRLIGVASFLYIALHLLLYVADEKFDLPKVANEILLRFYLTIGFVAFLGLLALAATSFDAAQRWLGGRRWQRLHRLTYPMAVLAVAHFTLQTKSDIWEATLCAGLFLWLMGYRWLAPKGGAPGVMAMLGLAIAATLATALAEFSWYALATGVNAWRVLEANLDISFGLRPALWVGLAGLAAFLLRCIPRGRTRTAPAAA